MMKKITDLITVAAVCMVILCLSLLFFMLPDSQMSEKENRSLATMPKFSLNALASGQYTADLANYIADQFPARDVFVSVKAYSELVFGKRENNGIIYAENDTLIERSEISENRIADNLNAVKELQASADVPICVAAVPRKVDVFSGLLPTEYPKEDDAQLWTDFYNTAKQLSLTAPKLYDALCDGNNYYRTDHHYNIYGAYSTYQILGEPLGYTPVALSEFSVEKVSDDFCGTAMRTSGFYLAKRDEITLLRYKGDTDYTVTADGKSIELYDMSKLEATDKYAVFLGGNHARVDIISNGEKPKLLVIRDSFADCLAPFLAIHYDITLIDLRYYNQSVQMLIENEKFDRVLLLESIDELATNKNLSKLRMVE
ncbi:MAG: hypothetical protein IJY79_06325 [Clostridia bacterium]|nr:hypothetical protein [Clostridia bacterium]